MYNPFQLTARFSPTAVKGDLGLLSLRPLDAVSTLKRSHALRIEADQLAAELPEQDALFPILRLRRWELLAKVVAWTEQWNATGVVIEVCSTEANEIGVHCHESQAISASLHLHHS